MSEEPEDTKPKLNLNITHEGIHITVKVKANMKFEKIFLAAEKRFGKESDIVYLSVLSPGTFKFIYEGSRLRKEETPAERGMEDGDMIDALLEQLGGGSPRLGLLL